MEKITAVYEDGDIIVCRKAAGIATQTKRVGKTDLVSLLKNYRVQNGEDAYIGVVHRLDQPVEGVMVFAKNPAAAANLSTQFAQHQVQKYYYAAVQAISDDAHIINSSWVTLTDDMTWDGRTNVAQIVPSGTKGAKKAILDYQILSVVKDTALVNIRLHTGRHHQIRVQMAHAGLPLIGDHKYGPTSPDTSLALCSYRLQFSHPRSEQVMDFSIRPEHPLLLQLLEKVS